MSYFTFVNSDEYSVFLVNKTRGQIIRSDNVITAEAELEQNGIGQPATWTLHLSGTGSLTHRFTGLPNDVINIVEDDIENLLLERNNE